MLYSKVQADISFSLGIFFFFIISPKFYPILRDHNCIIPQHLVSQQSALAVIHKAKQFERNEIAFCESILHKIVQKQQLLL